MPFLKKEMFPVQIEQETFRFATGATFLVLLFIIVWLWMAEP